MLAGGPGASKRGGMNVLVGQTTHHKMDANSQYNLQMKNQQEHQNQAVYGSKKKQADIGRLHEACTSATFDRAV